MIGLSKSEDKTMKKNKVLISIAVIAMVACDKIDIKTSVSDNNTDRPEIVINLNATHPDGPDTKAVKTSWELGDVIFVFFSEHSSPSYLEMLWNGSNWVCTPRSGLTLTDNETGTMRAVFLPFGSNEIVSADGSNYIFDNVYYSYYLTSSLPYKVTDGKLDGTINMQYPAGYVQFFINNKSADEDDVIEIREKHLQPRALDYIDSEGNIHEKIAAQGSPIVGYVYDKTHKEAGEERGYLFSGNLVSSARGASVDYLFTLVSGGAMGNYYTKQFIGKTLYRGESSGRAVKLPELASWNTTTTHKPIDLGIDVNGKRIYWSRCNLGATNEAESGDYYAWGETSKKTNYVWAEYKYGRTPTTLTKYNTLASYGKVDNLKELVLSDDVVNVKLGGNRRIPTDAEWKALRDNCTWTWKTTSDGYANNGYLVEGKGAYAGNSIFLPAAGIKREMELRDFGNLGAYWSSSLVIDSPDNAWRLGFSESAIGSYAYYRSSGLTIRPVID